MELIFSKCFSTPHSTVDRYLANRPSKHYKIYKIPKRTIGFRVIAQPTPYLKGLQRELTQKFKEVAKIHECAFAYREGRGIKENALMHLNSNYLLKVDIENFFNSITPKMLFKALNYQGLKVDDEDAFSEILFWNRSKRANGKLILSVGAPSSPIVSNIVMYSFDERIAKFCTQHNVTYTRYADDLTFSTKDRDVLQIIYEQVSKSLRYEFGLKMLIKSSKTVFSSKKHNRHVTGITLTNSNNISIGRTRKRYISCLVHKFKIGQLSLEEISYLQGLLSFSQMVEPAFIDRLRLKYDDDVIRKLKKFNSEGL